jgi:DNA-binding NtrC family response regulator
MTGAPKSLQILVVDDDDVDREQVRRLLDRSAFDFQVTGARDAELAQRLFDSRKFDCVLLDCHLAGIDGLDLIEKFTRDSTPVLMISGHEDAATAAEALKRGVKAYLMKNRIGADCLQQAIFRAVGKTVDANT